MRFFVLAAAFPFVLVAAACSDTETSQLDGANGSTGSAIDDRVKPTPTGACTTEAEACKLLSDTIKDRQLSVKCIGTSQSCPDMLRSIYGATELTYDLGTVDACVKYFSTETNCAKLAADHCVLVAYADQSQCK